MAITNKPIKLNQVELIVEDYEKSLKTKLNESELKSKVEGQGFKTEEDLKETFIESDELEIAIEDAGFTKTEDLDGKYVAKENGKGLSTNDYDETEKAKVAGAVQESELAGKVNNIVGAVYHPQGSKANFAEIQAVSNPQEGDVWNAEDTGANYAYTAQGTWDKLSETVDLSGYYDKDAVDGKLGGKLDTTTAERDYAKKNDLPTDYLTDDDIEGFLKEEDIVFAQDSEVLQAIASGKQKANQA